MRRLALGLLVLTACGTPRTLAEVQPTFTPAVEVQPTTPPTSTLPETVVATELAVRVAAPATSTTTTPEPVGLQGLPFAPAELEGCAEMNWYRQQWDLPARFSDQPREPAVPFVKQGLGWRESNCKNTVTSKTGCCVGYYQLYIPLFLSRPGAMRDRLHECDVDEPGDVLGEGAYDKQRQACAARALLDVQGMQAWSM